jgi:hypothetical protein
MLLVSACVAGSRTAPPTLGGATASATAAVSASTSEDCIHQTVYTEHAPFTIANLAAHETVVVATVKAIGPSVFNTADGRKPLGYPRVGSNATVVTPVVLDVSQVVRGDAQTGPLQVLLSGGQAECVTVTVDIAPELEAGQRYVFFVYPSFDADNTKRPDLPRITTAWPVDANGAVQTELEGSMSLASLAAAVAQVSPAPEP